MPKELLDRLSPVDALVVGDLILDRYAWGSVERLSPEAPIQILKLDRDDSRLGGAGNVAANLAALGARTALVGRTGRDAEGRDLARLARAAGVRARLVMDDSAPTVLKTRFLAQDQQILRVDRECAGEAPEPVRRALSVVARAALPRRGLLVFSDYAKGALPEGTVRRLLVEARRRGLVTVAGPKRGLERYRGATALSLNLSEISEAAGAPLRGTADVVRAGERLRRALGLEALLVTRGKEGVTCLWRGGRPFHAEARARSVYDVTGAGDTVLAVFALALANGAPPPQAAFLANVAGGLVVGKLGAATVGRAEIGAETGSHPAKLKTLEALAPLLAQARRAGQRVVFTNGCFDLIHPGHVRLLERARACGDRLVVGLNSDRSVRRLKGPGRPLQPQADRAAVLAGLSSVDDIVLFDEDTPRRLIERIRPQVLVKGSDYAGGTVVGRGRVEADGGEVRLVPLVSGASSSGLIERIRRLPAGSGKARGGFSSPSGSQGKRKEDR